MKKLLLFFIASLGTTAVTAALPPYYESMREIAMVISDPQVTQIITSARPIQSIVKTGTGYNITAGDCTLSVDILSAPPKSENGTPMVGPADLKVQIAQNTCTKN